MIPGIVASSAGGPAPSGGMSDAAAFFDFRNEVYTIDGAPVAVGDNIDKPGNVIPGSGLSIDWDTPGDVVTPIGDLLAKLCLAEFTIVVEAYLHEDTEGSNISWINARLASDPSDFYWYIFAADAGASFDSDNVDGVGGQRFFFVPDSLSLPGVRRVVMTRTASKLVGSTNGSAISTDTSSWSGIASAMDTAILGAQVGDTDANFKGFIRMLAVLPVRDDADLPALSTP